ncbi:MAG: SsrA-binding protein SmpB [Clostridia bacterium]|nr:SsrA-binding protein SmpB [Clostridia bacterium]
MEGIKMIAPNKKARHEYFLEEEFEAGISLAGTEVKSLRGGNVNFRDSYATIRNGEVFIVGLYISPYEKGNINNKDPERDRKLLLHKAEIRKLIGKTEQKGYSLIPTKIYFKRNKVKIEIALAKGKKLYDKRHDIADKDAARAIDRKLKSYNK